MFPCVAVCVLVRTCVFMRVFHGLFINVLLLFVCVLFT